MFEVQDLSMTSYTKTNISVQGLRKLELDSVV